MAISPEVTDEQFQDQQDERRIKDVTQARSLYNDLQYYNIKRSQTTALVRGQLEGARPYDPADLESQGAAWQTNVNFGDAEAARDRTLLPYWKAVHGAPNVIAVTIDSGSPDSPKWEAAITESFDQFIADWGQDYFVNYMRMAKNFVDFGPGIVMWDDPDKARFKAVNSQRVLFPKNATMSPDEWECVILEREMSAPELYAKIRTKENQKNAEYLGWNSDAVKAALVWAKEGTNWDGRDFTRWQDMLVNNDIAISTKFQPITVIWVYVKQYDGSIGCYAFTKVDAGDEFLYSKDDYAEDFKTVLGAVWYDIGTDAMVHSIKGFGIKNYHFSVLTNRMKSRVCDGASMAMAMNFMRNADTPDEAPPIENYGSVNVFPQGLTQIQTYPQFSQGLQILEMLEQNAAENNALYREQQQQIQETDTATQAKILATMQGAISEASMTIYLAQVGENLYTQCFERLRRSGNTDPDAKKFRKRCLDKGVPKEVLNDGDIRVTTAANAGMANPALRTMKFQQAMALGSQPGVNGRWFLEQYIANEFGPRAVQKALLPEGQDSNPLQRRQAMMENGDFGQGMTLPVDPSDAHVEHIEEHMKPLVAAMQQYKGQGGQIDPKTVPALVITLEHTGQHFQFLQNDETKKSQFKQLFPAFSQVQSVLRGILTKLQAQQQQQQALQGGPVPQPGQAGGIPQGQPAQQPAFPTGMN